MSATETLVDITLFTLRDTSDRHASERNERIASALEQIQDVRNKAEERKKGTGETARCSTTDPDARRMKMADGGFVSLDDITVLEQKGTTVFVPIKEEHSAARPVKRLVLQNRTVRFQQTPEWHNHTSRKVAAK